MAPGGRDSPRGTARAGTIVGGRQYGVCARSGRMFDNIGAGSIAWKKRNPEAAGYYVFVLPKKPAGSKK
jgi:hypothetical protein